MKLIAVCTGAVAPLMFRTASGELKTVTSGIKKQVVSDVQNPAPVSVGKLGLTGDEQCDLTVHGGLDKAVYMMPAQHYEFWNAQRLAKGLEANLPWGFLGENLVVEGLSEDQVKLGDEIRIGEVLMRVTQPRQPCYKFAIRMGYGAAPKQMVQAGNCGWYLSVIETGEIAAGEPLIHTPSNHPKSVLDQFRFLTRKGQMDLL